MKLVQYFEEAMRENDADTAKEFVNEIIDKFTESDENGDIELVNFDSIDVKEKLIRTCFYFLFGDSENY